MSFGEGLQESGREVCQLYSPHLSPYLGSRGGPHNYFPQPFFDTGHQRNGLMKGQSECDKSSTVERDYHYHFWVRVKCVFLLFSIARIGYMRKNQIIIKSIILAEAEADVMLISHHSSAVPSHVRCKNNTPYSTVLYSCQLPDASCR